MGQLTARNFEWVTFEEEYREEHKRLWHYRLNWDLTNESDEPVEVVEQSVRLYNPDGKYEELQLAEDFSLTLKAGETRALGAKIPYRGVSMITGKDIAVAGLGAEYYTSEERKSFWIIASFETSDGNTEKYKTIPLP